MSENFEIANISGVSCYYQDGTAYLRLEDVARGLGFTKKANSGNEVVNWTRVRQYLADLGVVHFCTTGDYIPENIFYRLAMKAKNEAAEKFQALVADEIIPSIRKHGAYITPAKLNELLHQPESVIEMLTALSEEQKKNTELMAQNKELVEKNEYMTPRSDYCDNVLTANVATYTATDIAKEYGWSAAKLNKKLHDLHIIRKVGNKWHLYWDNDGYDRVIYKQAEYYCRSTGKVERESRMYWTERGKAYIYDRLKEEGILPRSEASRKVKEN